MRILEIILLISVLLTTLKPCKRYTIMNYLFLTLHLIIDNPRWQMFPLYSVIFFQTKIFIPAVTLQKKRLKLLGVVAILSSLIVGLLFPVFTFPTPSGIYTVGTKSFHLIDENRYETFTDAPDDQRELMLKVWYPSDSDSGSAEPYWSEKSVGRLVSKSMSLPFFIFDHLALVKTNSYPFTAVSQRRKSFPVLIFSHGYQSIIAQNTILMEELASNGYIVISVGHSYDAAGIIFPNGEIKRSDTAAYNKLWERETKFADLYLSARKTDDVEKKRSLLKQFSDSVGIHKENIAIRVGDIKFVLDKLPELNKEFAGKIELDKIGVLGHSYGGATMAETCVNENRIKAGINLDGFQHGSLIDGGEIHQPFMIFYNGNSHKMNDFMYENVLSALTVLQLDSSRHFDFTDFPILSPLTALMGITGKNSSRKTFDIINSYTLAFFNKHLKGEEDDLLSGETELYPEVKFSR